MVSRGASEVTHRPGIVASYGGYRAPQGMLSWALHRISGLGVLAFLLLHIVDIFVVGYGPGPFNNLLFLYSNPIFRIGEIVLVGAVYYHSANGIRIILIDFWPAAYKFERQLYYVVMTIFIVGFIATAAVMIADMF
ncbi:MAG TPA: succinate dehydrogenase, cytochrome b556 subunit [Nitrolancea sp.]|nr:succinate dehydrogenase, cytochrome b556 subunit [Nitrolancea sp.]